MDVDNPNRHYETPFLTCALTLAQTDDKTLSYVLLHLADAVPDHSVDVLHEDIENLNMIDLRPLLVSREYDKVARTVLERLSTSWAGPSVPMPSHTAVLNAFTTPYQGDTTTLRMAIDQVINDQDLYSNGIPFVQSSGTGKSRLMVELGKDIFVLIVNLRDDDPHGSFSFPEPDIAVREHLLEMHYPTSVAERWRLRYAAFLCAVFDMFSETLGGGVPSEFAKIFETPASKSSYLNSVIQRSERWEEKFTRSYTANGGKTKCSQITSPDLLERAQKCFTKLRNVNPSKPPPPLVLALDEAHVMTRRKASPVPGSLLDIFCSVLADIKEASADWTGIIHFAAIFLSTNSQLIDVAPAVGQIVSQRSRTTSLAGALTCIPFDVFVERNKTWTVGEISTLQFISTFGRPLFGALIKHDLDPLLALTLAQEKLAHARRPLSVETLTKNQTAFALLARRVLLHFRPLQSSSKAMSSNLIARHLQVAFVVPKHRHFVVSGSPSEPFLIEAAAHMMATPGFSAIRCLLNFANEGLLNAGESCEIVGRSLTIDAYDIALRNCTPPTSTPIYHSWLPVLDFFKALFTDKVYEDIIKIKPLRQPDGQSLGEAFKNAVIRLTHYVRLSQLNAITAANVRKAFLRGMGLVGAESQELIDVIIPMLFVDLEKQPSDWIVDQTRLSHLMANWKNKAADATAPHTDPYDVYAELNMGLPTILMWNQFGSKKSSHHVPQASRSNYPERAVYFMDLYGIGPEVYRAITTTNQQEYLQFVGCEDMFRDAPYIFKEYQSAVEGTLPRWSATSFAQTAS